MKTITIGRSENSNIYIEDPIISRRHAILKISTFGKMEIVDTSTNGTFVNGVRIRSNTPFPVSRKDVINFGNVRRLDWAQIEDVSKYYKRGAIALAVLIAIILLFALGKSLLGPSDSNENIEGESIPVTVDKKEHKEEKENNVTENENSSSLEDFDYDAAVRKKKAKDAQKFEKSSPKQNSTEKNKQKEKSTTKEKEKNSSSEQPKTQNETHIIM